MKWKTVRNCTECVLEQFLAKKATVEMAFDISCRKCFDTNLIR